MVHRFGSDVAFRAFGEWVRSPRDLGAEEDRAPGPQDCAHRAWVETEPGDLCGKPRDGGVQRKGCCPEVCHMRTVASQGPTGPAGWGTSLLGAG